MKEFPRIILTNANLKVKVTLMVNNIDFYYHSDTAGATLVAFEGQNIFPAAETVLEIDKLIDSLGGTDGSK